MSENNLTIREWLISELSISFDEAVKRLKESGYKVKSKIRVRMGQDSELYYYENEFFPLDYDYPLGEGEFWVPLYFDGKQLSHKLVAPAWLEGDEVIKFFSEAWKLTGSPDDSRMQISPDSREYILEELRKYSKLGAKLRVKYRNDAGEIIEFIRPDDKPHDAQEVGRGLIEMDYNVPGSPEAYEAQDCLSEAINCLEEPQEDENGRVTISPPPIITPNFWRAVEYGYRAGRAAEQSDSTHIYELARKAPASKPKKSLFNLKPWEERVANLLVPEVVDGKKKFPRSEMLSLLTDEGLNETRLDEKKDGKTELLEGEAKWMTVQQFEKRISDIVRLIKEHRGKK